MVEFGKDTLKLGQRWKRADGHVAIVRAIEDDKAKLEREDANLIAYHYVNGGQSQFHCAMPGSRLVELIDDGEPKSAPVGDSIEDGIVPAEEEPIVLEQEVIVNTAISSLVGNYPSIGYAVVRIGGLQIEVDFEEHSLAIQDNPNPHDAFSNI